MNYPKVSILISIYNQLHCLEKALQSALEQDYPNLEIIIGDDCSTEDNVEQFVEQISDERVKYFCNERNLGVNGNYRTMLKKHASGEYAVVLNADDYWIDSKFISNAVRIFLQHKEVVMVFGNIYVYIEDSDVFFEDNVNKVLPSIVNGNQFFIDYPNGYSLPHLTCVYNRQKAISLNFYSNNIISSDWESLLKLILGNQLGYIPKRVGVLTRHYDNYSKNTTLDSLYQSDTYINNLYHFALKNGNFTKKQMNRWRFQMLKRHHSKWLIKLWFLDKKKLPIYKKYLKSTYPRLYRNIQFDFRYQGYRFIRKFPFLLKWIFRRVLKQESFIVDLLAYQTNKKHEV